MEKQKEDGDHVTIQDLTTQGDKALSFELTFHVDYENPITGERLSGNFSAKRMTLGEWSRFGAIKARLAEGERNIDSNIDWMNEMIAFSMVSLTDAPKWWNPMELYDEALLARIFGRLRSFQDSFRKRVGERRGKAPADGSAAAGDRVASAVVVPEVQSPT